jgi:GNAT superfamily N-acetyltransferase
VSPGFSEPEVIRPQHLLQDFNSGEAVLNDWLKNCALDNLALGASRTYVSCTPGTLRVIAYYALSMGSILGAETTGAMRRNMPKLIPSIILGRLAVDQSHQGLHLGAQMLQDAVKRSRRAAQDISARLIIVHALSPKAEAFYLHHGFTRLPIETPVLGLDLVKLV